MTGPAVTASAMPAEWMAHAAVLAGEVPVDVAAWADDDGDEFGPPLPSEDVRGWRITDDAAAAWALRKLAAAQAEIAEVTDRYRVEVSRLNEWRDRMVRRPRDTVDYMADRLKAYGLERRAEDPKRATISTPAGEIRTRAPSEANRWQVVLADDETLLAWAEENDRDDLLRRSLAPVTAIRSRCEIAERIHVDAEGEHVVERIVVDRDSGALVPGLAVEEKLPTVSLHPAAE